MYLRNEIRKMGTEGVKLLEQREREIGGMRRHLKTVLKDMEFRDKVRILLSERTEIEPKS